MIFERFEVSDLSHYSYAVGCAAAGAIAIVDPKRDVDTYLEFAARNGVRITHVLETHIHADFASGARQLAQEAGAELCVSAYDDGETYEVAFPHRDLREGDAIEIGAVRIEALHTPGHTPEHLAYLVYDGMRSSETPILMLSGDFLFVGSLGRPDLLGEEAKRGLAHAMYRSVTEKLAPLPDGLEIHPAHGAGSMCGAGMSGRPSSTLGYERIANPYLAKELSEEEFVATLLGTVPLFPPYYRRMKRINSEGPAPLDPRRGIAALSPEEVSELAASGGVVVDLRASAAYGAGHVPGSLGVGLAGSFATWSAWVVPYDVPLVLLGDADDGAETFERAVRSLMRVGLDDVAGRAEGGLATWRSSGREVATTEQLSPRELNERLEREGGAPHVVDVRAEGEWAAGHVPGAKNLNVALLAERVAELPDDGRPLAVICAGGYRSTIAASVLERSGRSGVLNVAGGMAAWNREKLAVETG